MKMDEKLKGDNENWVLTTAMRNDASLPHILNPFLLDQPQQRIERSTSFKRSDSLLVLAFEEKIDPRRGREVRCIAIS